jgi:hypothetical protein
MAEPALQPQFLLDSLDFFNFSIFYLDIFDFSTHLDYARLFENKEFSDREFSKKKYKRRKLSKEYSFGR